MFSFFFDLPSPEIRAARAARQAAWFERLAAEAIPWDFAKMRIPRETFCLKAETYRIDYPGPVACPPGGESVRSGDWSFRHRPLPRGSGLLFPTRPDSDSQPHVYFDADVEIPVLARHEQTWMSTTPAEMLSQRGGVRSCRGHAVIGGLGMGWFLHEVSKRSQVDRITVIEQDRSLLDWYGEDLCRRYGAELIHGDVWEVIRGMPADDGTRYAIDIWAEWFDARHDRNLRNARRSGKTIWAWGSPRGGEAW